MDVVEAYAEWHCFCPKCDTDMEIDDDEFNNGEAEVTCLKCHIKFKVTHDQ